MEHLEMVEFDFSGAFYERSDQGSWSHVTNALLRRIITDEVLSEAQDEVAEAV